MGPGRWLSGYKCFPLKHQDQSLNHQYPPKCWLGGWSLITPAPEKSQGIWGPKWHGTLDPSVSCPKESSCVINKLERDQGRHISTTSELHMHTVIHNTDLYIRDHYTLCNIDVCLSFGTSILCMVRITGMSTLQWKRLTFELSLNSSLHVCIVYNVYTHTLMYPWLHAWSLEDNLQESVPSLTLEVPGTTHRSSGLAASSALAL